MFLKRIASFAWVVLGVAISGALPAETTAQALPETMAMLQHAISIETVKGKGQVPVLARYLAGKLESAGFARSDVQIIPVGNTAALIATYRGTDRGAKPIVINGHMDVVAASNPGAWSHPPFTLTRDGKYFYGRGVADMKTAVVVMVETLMRLKREGFKPHRDIILALTGDEETDEFTTEKLAKRLRNAEFLLDADGWGGVLDAQGKPVIFGVESAEKGYVDFRLEATSPGGHSSEPSPSRNAIYRLVNALHRIAVYPFPVRSNSVSLTTLKAMAGRAGDSPLTRAMRAFAANPLDAQAASVLSGNPTTVGLIRTTCIATMLHAGHARNALPERATANVNCRVFPGATMAQVQSTLAKVVADPAVTVTRRPPFQPAGPISPPREDVMSAVTAAIHARYPGLEVVPVMIGASSDMKYFRRAGIPSYGVAPFFAVPGEVHAHGINERLRASEIAPALEFWHRLLEQLGSAR